MIGLIRMDKFYQNQIQTTVDKTKYVFVKSNMLFFASFLSLVGAIITMYVLNITNTSISNPDMSLTLLILGNAVFGFYFFSMFFAITISFAVICIILFVLTSYTKKQVIGIKYICVDYIRVLKKLRDLYYELDKENICISISDSIKKIMKKYNIKSQKALGKILTQIHNMLVNHDKRLDTLEKTKKHQNVIILNQNTRIQKLEEKDKKIIKLENEIKELNKKIDKLLREESGSINNQENTKTSQKNKFEPLN